MLETLAEINKITATHSRYVSEGCWVTSQTAEGRVRRTASKNFGFGAVPQVMGGLDLSEFVKKNFRDGNKMHIVQSAGAIYGPGDGIPLPPPTGELRSFTFSSTSGSAALGSETGGQGISINVSPVSFAFQMRCNEEVIVPFARLMFSSGPVGAEFGKPLLPWPQVRSEIVIDDFPIPRGWEYSVGYWIENRSHRVVIPQSSRSVRNLAFLGPQDEIVIVAPTVTMEFVWTGSADAPSTTLYARIIWRSRFDGTLR